MHFAQNILLFQIKSNLTWPSSLHTHLRRGLHQSPGADQLSQKEVPQAVISKWLLSQSLQPNPEPRSPPTETSRFHAESCGSYNCGCGLRHLRDLHRTGTQVPATHIFLWSCLTICPRSSKTKTKNNWKLTCAEDTRVPNRGDKISKKTKHVKFIFWQKFSIITTDVLVIDDQFLA